ncbi:hypothetical protein ACFRAE_01305 [Sphingobacterium sp. HJSM2_6]|uniref:hypothetical protein n=1 Tax=Sphingobacterium sp. HJSM2_6 TaxID=3366264 RepID=UPI003BCE18E8
MNIQNTLKTIVFILCTSILMYSCSKDEYYSDGGQAQAKFDGSILDYMDSKPVLFDTIAQIIRLAGLEETFKNDEFTFFAPSDPDIKDLIGSLEKGGLNSQLFGLGLDTIKNLSDVDSAIWRNHLLKYMFRGKNLLKDYPQIDYSLISTFPGQHYISFAGNITNIGVEYQDVIQYDGNGNETSRLKYMGYRQLNLNYISDETNPNNFWQIPVSSSDIQPNNGVIHVLNYTKSSFGLDNGSWEIINDILESKR